MTKLEQIKNQLELAKNKKVTESLEEWMEGYIDGLKRAIEIIEEEN
ncbi:MAG: hypothetical protein AWU54_2151 [Candidatus Frackibacter sp. T328-2]|jgi:hypothetical protein|nr:MAG: hypothetical protein AWU54_2151 [Candidatus Frackibacter sp. T328-2]